jgi:hypothetical protein
MAGLRVFVSFVDPNHDSSHPHLQSAIGFDFSE